MISKVFNYGIPYIFFSILWWSFKVIFSNHVNSTLTLRDLLLIPLYPISFMWFIYALMIMVVLQIVIGGHKSTAFKACHFAIALFAYIVQPFLAKTFSSICFDDLVVSDVMKNYIYFLLGVYGWSYIIDLYKSEKYTVLLLATGSISVIYNIVRYNGIIQTDFFLVRIAVAFCGCVFIILLCQHMQGIKALDYTGRCCLSVYVLQGLSIAATRQLMNRITDNTILPDWQPLLICTIAGTLIPLFIYYFSTKIWKLDFVFNPMKYIKIK